MTSPTSNEPQFGFIILISEPNAKALRTTVNSITTVYPKHAILGVAPTGLTKDKLAEFAAICDIVKGKDTITSLINAGMKKTKVDWNVIVFSGSWIRNSFYKIFKYATDRRDVLFPVVNRKIDFIEGSMNGIVVHKETFQEVGPMADIMHKDGVNDLEMIKTFWALEAMDKGCKFKAIHGIKVC